MENREKYSEISNKIAGLLTAVTKAKALSRILACSIPNSAEQLDGDALGEIFFVINDILAPLETSLEEISSEVFHLGDKDND